jgi:hypothetical protein
MTMKCHCGSHESDNMLTFAKGDTLSDFYEDQDFRNKLLSKKARREQ